MPIYPKGAKVATWVDFSKESISGEWEIEVVTHSTAAPNDADKLQSIAFFVQSINPLLQLLPIAAQSGINLLPLVREVLKALPDIQDPDEIIEGMGAQAAPAPQPGAQQPFINPVLSPAPDALLQALNGYG